MTVGGEAMQMPVYASVPHVVISTSIPSHSAEAEAEAQRPNPPNFRGPYN